ncbi:VOC family protein [Xanthocytophaga agilis]|uniref:Glyoxalase/bleomycin resistance/extradiol dioxygenase family protein n=1 Tax=Xanthocytophaga agilis TaxID=3048010 RepID=A0AAE3RAC1_9BACT|nr:VOC family protein [Xanthocytophaga agilis]MDJ1504432.1 glyoxalase/bleomycin resistance/extradiol dioxygenase family protein [Xanthocytophaga agilis]
MANQIFINLPVKDLKKSMDFFTKLGFSFNMQFTDDTAACMVISETIYSMLLTHDKFKEFTSTDIADTSKVREVLTCLAVDSKEEVNAITEKAIHAGAIEEREAKDYGFMYYRSFADLDGHVWEMMWMDPTAENGTEAQADATMDSHS